MPTRIPCIHPVISTVRIQMQALRLILLPGIRIPRQEPPLLRLVIPRPQVHFPCLLIVILPAVAEGVVIFLIRLYLIAEGVIFIGLGDFSIPICQLHHIPMGIGHIILQLIFCVVVIHHAFVSPIPYPSI